MGHFREGRPKVFTTRPEVQGTFGIVSSTHWLASSVGMGVLERGGNAFDAAVAAGFLLQIVEPHLNGPGGEVPIIFKSASDSQPRVLCGQGTIPALATRDAFAALGISQVPGTGLLPSVVPGAFDAWMVLLRDYGTLTPAQALEPAVCYARDGFPLLPRVSSSILAAKEFFTEHWPTSAAAWLRQGEVPRPNTVFMCPDIAKTYSQIVSQSESSGSTREQKIEAARHAFYKGFVAEAIDRFYRTAELMDSTGSRHGGFLRASDLSDFEATYEETVSINYHGLQVHKTGSWGQGPVLLQTLRLLEGYDLSATDPNGTDFVHTIVECMKLAYADREAFYGDPNFVDIPLATLLSREYADSRRQLVGDEASLALTPGDIGQARERVRRVMLMAGKEKPVGIGSGEPTFASLPVEWGDTCHLDVIDRHGNMVSATPSGGWLQSSPTIPDLGFSISTRAQMTWLEEGHPSTLRPRSRPRTTLTPTLITRDGENYLAMGTPGGDQQDQWTLTSFLRHVHHRLNLQAAIEAPLFTSRHFPQSFYPRVAALGHLLVEERFDLQVRRELQERGHIISVEGPWSLGRVCAVGQRDGLLVGAATPRLMQAYAVGR